MTKKEMHYTIFNPSSAKANRWMIERYKKSTYEEAMEIRKDSRTKAKKYLAEANKRPEAKY